MQTSENTPDCTHAVSNAVPEWQAASDSYAIQSILQQIADLERERGIVEEKLEKLKGRVGKLNDKLYIYDTLQKLSEKYVGTFVKHANEYDNEYPLVIDYIESIEHCTDKSMTYSCKRIYPEKFYIDEHMVYSCSLAVEDAPNIISSSDVLNSIHHYLDMDKCAAERLIEQVARLYGNK